MLYQPKTVGRPWSSSNECSEARRFDQASSATILAAVAACIAVPSGVFAENGEIAAGVLGGLAVGIGSAAAPRPYAPPPVYVAPPPVVYEAPACYWTRRSARVG